ncbi:universal stress protein [Paraburkholderia graminis]|uniref:universal stress protein n=1 Tax=Paraburkholderia graminis TaxID=60548 RepID=UPI00286CC779|nr:universal stress protein [Paraburkholderia graminis]
MQRDVREVGPSPERPATRGCYRRLVVVVRDGGALPVMSVDYADAWAMPDAVAVVAVLPDAASGTDGAGQGGGGVCRPDIATADAVRCALLARGVDAGASYALQLAAGANAAQSIGEMAHRWGADLVLCDDRSIAHLAQAAACNVLFVPTDQSRRYCIPPRRIFVASDDSASALCAVTEARRLAGEHAQLRRAYLSFDAESAPPTDAATIVLAAARNSDNLAHAIVQAAGEWSADLLIMGTHSTAAQAVWRYGSVGAAVALVAEMPLLLVVGKS